MQSDHYCPFTKTVGLFLLAAVFHVVLQQRMCITKKGDVLSKGHLHHNDSKFLKHNRLLLPICQCSQYME